MLLVQRLHDNNNNNTKDVYICRRNLLIYWNIKFICVSSHSCFIIYLRSVVMQNIVSQPPRVGLYKIPPLFSRLNLLFAAQSAR
jgi:hypothetical protein